MGPIVLILSFGFSKPIDIVQKLSNFKTGNKILKPKEIEINDKRYKVYDYKVKNKYFEIDIKLLPYTDCCGDDRDGDDGKSKSIETLPKELLQLTEGLIVSFDSSDKSFLTHVPTLCKLVDDNNIELNLLLTGQLFDDANVGLCYGDVKDLCKQTFDVIEILSQTEDLQCVSAVEDYSEIIEALENQLWSHVDASKASYNVIDKQIDKASDSKNSHVDADADGDDADADTVDDVDSDDEQQLDAYENLLTNVLNFKNKSSKLNRNQMLNEAEKLAELFTGLMGDD